MKLSAFSTDALPTSDRSGRSSGFVRALQWAAWAVPVIALLACKSDEPCRATLEYEAPLVRWDTRELNLLTTDIARLLDRVDNLDRHFDQAHEDIRKIKISAEKAGNRAERLGAIGRSEGVVCFATALISRSAP